MVDVTKEIAPLPLSEELVNYINRSVNTKDAIRQLQLRYPNCSMVVYSRIYYAYQSYSCKHLM